MSDLSIVLDRSSQHGADRRDGVSLTRTHADAFARAGRDVALDVYCRVKAGALPGSQHYVSADSAITAMRQSVYRGCPTGETAGVQ